MKLDDINDEMLTRDFPNLASIDQEHDEEYPVLNVIRSHHVARTRALGDKIDDEKGDDLAARMAYAMLTILNEAQGRLDAAVEAILVEVEASCAK
jgi:hypothetical protein